MFTPIQAPGLSVARNDQLPLLIDPVVLKCLFLHVTAVHVSS